jgi:hypothetical protein
MAQRFVGRQGRVEEGGGLAVLRVRQEQKREMGVIRNRRVKVESRVATVVKERSGSRVTFEVQRLGQAASRDERGQVARVGKGGDSGEGEKPISIWPPK